MAKKISNLNPKQDFSLKPQDKKNDGDYKLFLFKLGSLEVKL